MSTVTEFNYGETCTATVRVPFQNGESYAGPLHIGYYTAGAEDADVEIWIEQDAKRIAQETQNV